MSTVYTQRFRNCDAEFIVRGTDPDDLPVFLVLPDGDERKTAGRFPACLRFMPHAELIGEFETDST